MGFFGDDDYVYDEKNKLGWTATRGFGSTGWGVLLICACLAVMGGFFFGNYGLGASAILPMLGSFVMWASAMRQEMIQEKNEEEERKEHLRQQILKRQAVEQAKNEFRSEGSTDDVLGGF